MAITVEKLFTKICNKYNVELIAGRDGIDNLVEWVHIIENGNISRFLHGNEVIFTCGMLNNTEEWLLNFIKNLYKVGASAFVINIGPYIKAINEETIEYCNKNNIPLYVMPWEMLMVDVTRDICTKLIKREQIESSLSSTIKNIIFKIGDLDTQASHLERYGFLRESKFCFIVLAQNNSEENIKIAVFNKIKKYAERIARSIQELYISFSYKDKLVLALVDYSEKDIKQFISLFFNKAYYNSKWNINMGISENIGGVALQSDNFNKGLIAMKMAIKKNMGVFYYDDLDIDQLLINVKDIEILVKYFNNTLGKVQKYDTENGTNLVDFLSIYLECNGSQSAVAEKLYIHRNTVNNQVKKIEKITGYNLLNLEHKVKLFLAIHIKDII